MTHSTPIGADDERLPRRLIIMRHAKSDWHTGVRRDFDRPLNERGQRDAPRMGHWLSARGWHPERVICSTAVRTRQTLSALMAPLQLQESRICFDQNVYDAELKELLRVLSKAERTANTVLLLGHNPGVSDLAHFLSATDFDSEDGLPTAAVACLAMPVDWTRLQANAGRLISLMTPKRLDD